MLTQCLSVKMWEQGSVKSLLQQVDGMYVNATVLSNYLRGSAFSTTLRNANITSIAELLKQGNSCSVAFILSSKIHEESSCCVEGILLMATKSLLPVENYPTMK